MLGLEIFVIQYRGPQDHSPRERFHRGLVQAPLVEARFSTEFQGDGPVSLIGSKSESSSHSPMRSVTLLRSKRVI
jgi:hypothetical protein